MKKLLIILLFFCSYSYAQVGDTPPLSTDPNFKTLSTSSLKYYILTKHIWVFRGNNTWTELASARDLKYQIDSLSSAGYTKLEIDNKLLLKLNSSEKGQAGGVATLDPQGKVPASQLSLTGEPIINPGNINQYLRGNKTWHKLLNDSIISGNETWTSTKINAMLSVTTMQQFEIEIANSGTTNVAVPFPLKNTSLVWVNGYILRNNLWAGIGTSTITLFVDIKSRDLLKIQN